MAFFPFFPSGNFSSHIGLSPRSSPVLQGWLSFTYMSETQEIPATILRQQGVNLTDFNDPDVSPSPGLQRGHRIPRPVKLKVTRCNPHVKTKEKREEGGRGPPSKDRKTYLSENCYQKPPHTLQSTTCTKVSRVAWACCCFPPRCNCSSDSQKSLNQEP